MAFFGAVRAILFTLRFFLFFGVFSSMGFEAFAFGDVDSVGVGGDGDEVETAGFDDFTVYDFFGDKVATGDVDDGIDVGRVGGGSSEADVCHLRA